MTQRAARGCAAGFVLAALATMASSNALAETFYVRADGDDAADGRSDATAWATLSRVNQQSFGPSDDVYFRSGDVWTAQALTIDWSGTAQDQVEVGAYHLSGGQETVGVGADARPLFDGEWVDIDGINKPLIDVRAEFVTVQDMHVYDSYGIGLRIGAGFTHNTLRRCKADQTGRGAISVIGTSDVLVEYCEASRGNIHYTLGNLSAWGSAIQLYRATNSVIRYCEAHDNVGEGINLVRGSHGSLAEYNFVWATYSVGIYVDSASDCTVRHNLVVGTTDPTYHHTEGWHGMGIAVNNEVTEHGPSDRTTILGNVVIARHSGIRFMNAQALATSDVWVVNNTLIDNERNFNISSPDTFSNVTIRNNLSHVHAADADHGSIHSAVFGAGSTMGSNFWSSEPHASLFDAGSDIVGDPGLTRSTGWRQLADRDSFATTDFALLPSSSAIDVGAELGAPYEQGMTTGTDFHGTTRTVVTVPQGEAGDGWDMGAWIYREAALGGGGAGGAPGGSGGSGVGGGSTAGGTGGAPPGGGAEPDSDGGCSCRVGPGDHGRRLCWVGLVLVAAGLRRRSVVGRGGGL